MINHKLKINDSKTEFLIIRSQFSKVKLPNLTVTVGDTEILSSDKARNLGVTFDSFMNLEPHITQGWVSHQTQLCDSQVYRRISDVR